MTAFKSALVPMFLFFCLTLGGASAGGFIANLILQIMAIGLVILSLLTGTGERLPFQERNLILVLIAGLVVVALQFLPLPDAVWEGSGKREEIASMARSAGILPKLTLVTLMPHESVKSATWLLPPLALVIAMLQLRTYRESHIAWVILAAVLLSILLGTLQVSVGAGNSYYLYERTNHGSAVGFFANSNHMATLLLISFPFLAALIKQHLLSNRVVGVGFWAVSGSVFLLMLVGIYVNGSFAGYGLAPPVVGASLLILVPSRLLRRYSVPLLGLMVLIGAAAIFIFEKLETIAESASDFTSQNRATIFSNTWKAIQDYMPLGSGLGSFEEIYRQYEDPFAVDWIFINHAHNDYLELILETGYLGGLVLIIFLVWWTMLAFRIWVIPGASPFAKAAMIATATSLLHSLVDYPLRTAAIGSIFAVSCVLMVTGSVGWQRLLPNYNDDRSLWRSLNG